MKNPLIGKTLTGVKIATDRRALLFQTTEGDIVVECDADCCSDTWVEQIDMPARGLPALVSAVDALEMPDLGEMPDRDVVAYYGCKISTANGELIIDYRNDSNGYYGGDLSWPSEHHYGGVYGQNNSGMEWIDVI